MMGGKERARKQAEAIGKAAQKLAWSHDKRKAGLTNLTEVEMFYYTEGAKTWAEKGNRLQQVMFAVRLMLMDVPGSEPARLELIKAIKEYDDLDTITNPKT